MSLPREGSREIDDGIIVSEAMDWCHSPTEPVPYRIWAKQVQATALANSVRQTDERSHVKGSIALASYGDEPGVGGGVVSGTRGAECTPKTWSDTVFAEGRNMVRHDDEWWMNHRNTYGRLSYVKDQAEYPTPEPQTIDPKLQLALYQEPGTATDAPAPGAGGSGPSVARSAPPQPEVSNPAPGSVPWFSRGTMLNPAGPGAMEGMGHLDRWLKDNVNEPGDWFSKGLRRRDRISPPPDPSAPQVPQSGIVRTTGDEKSPRCRCVTGSYKSIKNRCGPECGSTYQAHHIVPDYTLRYGNRPDGEAGRKRIPGLPSFDDGPAICLEGQKSDAGSEHGLAHAADAEVLKLGSSSAIQGTADIHSITEVSTKYANTATGYECTAQINEALSGQPSLDSDILGRTTLDPPDASRPSDKAAYDALSSGMRATKH